MSFRFVHDLVAEAFLGPRPAGLEINHKNGDKANNTPGNLEYATHAENMAHAGRSGLRRFHRGRRRAGAKLSDDDAQTIRSLRGACSQRAIAERFGIGQQMVSMIQRGKRLATVNDVPCNA